MASESSQRSQLVATVDKIGKTYQSLTGERVPTTISRVTHYPRSHFVPLGVEGSHGTTPELFVVLTPLEPTQESENI